MPRASFLLPPTEDATTTIVAFVPINPPPGDHPIVLVLDNTNPKDLAFTFPSEDFDVYALLYHCGGAILRVETGLQNPTSDSSQPIPSGAFKAFASRLRDREQNDWVEARLDDTVFSLKDVLVAGTAPTRCGLTVKTHTISNTAQIIRRPLALDLGDGRVLVGVETGPFEVISGAGTEPFTLSSMTPALAGSQLDGKFYMLGSGGEIASGTFDHGFQRMSGLTGTATFAAALVARTSSSGSPELFAATDQPIIQKFQNGSWSTLKRSEFFRPVYSVDMVQLANGEILAAIGQQKSLILVTSTGTVAIKLPNRENCRELECERVTSMALETPSTAVIGTRHGAIFRVTDGALENAVPESGSAVTAVARWRSAFVIADINGVIRLRFDDGEPCDVTSVQGVPSKILPLPHGFVAVAKDEDSGNPDNVLRTDVSVVVATEPQCESPQL